MNQSRGGFCRLYRLAGALLLLLPILFLLLRSRGLQVPRAFVPTVQVPTTAVPPTAVAVAAPNLKVPSAADWTADGLRLAGTGLPGSTVEVWDGATRIGTAVVGTDGLWSLVGKLGAGAHKLSVRLLDAAGNLLSELPSVDIDVPAAIAVPTLNLPSVADLTPNGLKLGGTGQPGATVELWDGVTKIGTAVVGADGLWSLVGKLSAGAHKLSVRLLDAAGKLLSELPSVDIDVPAAIAVPTLNLPSVADLTPNGLKLGGTGQPGATVELWDGATKIGTAVVGADGLWTLLSKLGAGAHRLALRMVDAGGMTLGQSEAVDITVPTPATLTAAAEVTADGVLLSGTGEPGTTLEVWDGATRVGTVAVGADGSWGLLSDLAAGAYKLAVRAVDAAGNLLGELAAVDVTVPAGQGPAPVEDLAVHGQQYIVQPGDWLIKLAQRFYGNRELYTRIVDGTNAKAAVDSSFEPITNPDLIYVGQKLWIPAAPGGK